MPFRPASTIAAKSCISAFSLTLAIGLAVPANAGGDAAKNTIAGPVSADVVKVRDGDTVEVEAHIWPQQTVRVAVRLRGIDAPELKAKCASEKAAALAAKDRLGELLAGGGVRLLNVSGDKYFGRVLAEISAEGEADVGRALLREGLAAPYRGEKRRNWCDGRSSLVPPSQRPG